MIVPRGSRRAQRAHAPTSATVSCGTSAPPPTGVEWPRCCRRCWPTARAPGSRTAGWSSTVIPTSSPSPSASTTCCTGTAGDGGPLGPAERAHYAAVLAENLDDMLTRVSPGDIVLLHDPQTAGLAEASARAGRLHVVWRCHVGRDDAQRRSRPRPGTSCARSSTPAELFVFSRRVYAPDWVDPRPAGGDPTVDRPVLDQEHASSIRRQVAAVLTTVGLVAGADAGGRRRTSTRRDGTIGDPPAPTRPCCSTAQPPPLDARLDRAGEPVGPAQGHARGHGGLRPDGGPTSGRPTHLMLAGPATCRASPTTRKAPRSWPTAWRAGRRCLPAMRERVHLAASPWTTSTRTPSSSTRCSATPTPWSRRAWSRASGSPSPRRCGRARPVVASKVGGIQDQIVDGLDGLLIEDPARPRGVRGRARPAPGRTRSRPAAREVRAGSGAGRFVGDRHLERLRRALQPPRRRDRTHPSPVPRVPVTGACRGNRPADR